MEILSSMEKKMRLERRIFLWSMLILGVIFIILLPIVSFLIGFILTATFGFRTRPADNLRPNRDIYASLTQKEILLEVASEEYEKLEKAEEAEKYIEKEKHQKSINRKETLKNSLPIILGIGLFLVSLVLLLMGFYGLLAPTLS